MAKDQKGRDPVCLAGSNLMVDTIDKRGLALLIGFEHRLYACTNKALDCGV